MKYINNNNNDNKSILVINLIYIYIYIYIFIYIYNKTLEFLQKILNFVYAWTFFDTKISHIFIVSQNVHHF